MNINRRLNTKRKTPVVAAVTSLALVAGAVVGANSIQKTQDAAPAPIEVMNESASLSDGASIVVDDPAVASQGEGDEARTVKEFTRDKEFSMFGLKWEGERDIVAFVRAERAPGQWSQWYELPQLDGPDGQPATATDLIFIEPTTKVQVSTGNVDLVEENIPDAPAPEAPAAEPAGEPAPAPAPPAPGEASPMEYVPAMPSNYGDIAPVADVEELPAPDAPAPAPAEPEHVHTTASDIEAFFINGGEGMLSNEIVPAANSYAWGMPKVVSRASWGAGQSSTPYYSEPVKATTVHHTAGSNNYTQAQAPGIVRGIWSWHAINNGWGDIGYNALVDKYGTIYEGKAGGLERGPQGAHAYGFNNNTFGISMMGNHEEVAPTRATINAVAEMVGWKAAVAGFDPTGTVYLNGRTLPTVFMHKDVGNTACPGRYAVPEMANIRSGAKSKYDQLRRSNGQPVNPAPKPNPTPNPAPAPAPAQDGNTGNAGGNTSVNNLVNASSQINFENLLAGDPGAIAGAVGTVIGAILLAATAAGVLPNISKVGNAQILPGIDLKTAMPWIKKAIESFGSPKAKSAVNTIEPILGQFVGTLQGVGGAEYEIYENGVATTGIGGDKIIMPEAVSSAWLKQGGDLGALGKPVRDASAPNNGDVRIEFERGYIHYSLARNNVDVTVDK